MDKAKFFEEQVKYWTKKVGLSPFIVKLDRRITKYAAYAYRGQPNEIRYSHKYINDYTKNGLIHLGLHEIGHIKTNTRYCRRWKREYEAEKFALNKIKKYIPNYYKKAVKTTNKYVTQYSKTKEKWQLPYLKGFGKLIQELER